MSSHKSLSFSIILGTLLLLFVSVACGTSARATVSTPAPTSTSVQKCGTIGVRPDGSRAVNLAGNPDANSTGTCFWRAYQQCHAASLVVNFTSVDTITTHTFSIQKNTGCKISDAVQHRVVPQPARNGGTFICSSLVKTPDELHFRGCGKDGDIVVPIGR